MESVDLNLISPFGSAKLERFPSSHVGREKSLRAWDAADELILDWLHEQGMASGESVAVINDSFGALATTLNEQEVHFVSDSYTATYACKKNLEANGSEFNVSFYSSLELPTKPVKWLVIKVPKTLAYLEDMLVRCRSIIDANTQIVAGGMVKHLSRNAIGLFELLGETTTSLAKKKARLIFCQPNPQGWQDAASYPSFFELGEWQIANHSNVFSRETLDIGTRFFLPNLPKGEEALDIIDLGCGNGVVGMTAAKNFPNASVSFIDESYMAVASSQQNFERYFPSRDGQFYAGYSLTDVESGSADMILNNPPFHQQQVVGDHIAVDMFKQSKRVLRKHGQLWVVGNRHLGYHQRLKKIFGNCQLIASNKKFVILKATKI